MEVPKCANFLEGKCERSDTVVGETKDGRAYVVFCRTCKLVHGWSRSKTISQAREQVRAKRVNEMTARERQQARQAVKFYAPATGWRKP